MSTLNSRKRVRAELDRVAQDSYMLSTIGRDMEHAGSKGSFMPGQSTQVYVTTTKETR